MAKLMELPLEAIGELSFHAKQEVRISSTCAVFGQSEVSSLLRQGRNKADIIAGLHTAVAERIIPLLRRVGMTPDFVITGGIAKNAGVVRRVEERIGLKALLPDEPQIVGALGAALFAWDKVSK
jgi:activator of 2-hydroxyglutaryl-CoA dehydratase